MRRIYSFYIASLLCLFLFSGSLVARDKENEKNASDEDSTKTEKLYHEVITDDAVTMEGLMTVHQIDQKYFLEIKLLIIKTIYIYLQHIFFMNATRIYILLVK